MHRYIDDIILISTYDVTSIPIAYTYLKLTERTLQNNIINFLDFVSILKNRKMHTNINLCLSCVKSDNI